MAGPDRAADSVISWCRETWSALGPLQLAIMMEHAGHTVHSQYTRYSQPPELLQPHNTHRPTPRSSVLEGPTVAQVLKNCSTLHGPRRVLRLLVTADVTLMMETIRSSETSVLTRAKRRNMSEGGILHSHRRENLKSHTALTGYY
jgi:hypothetical protein